MMSSQNKSLPFAPPPWTCKCTAYVLTFYNSASSGLPVDVAYAPLEAGNTSLRANYRGGLCMAQIIRYSETPVGPYDELVIIPSAFEVEDDESIKSKHSRITGIWVSQEATLMNGRKNWNIPKHLARFSFTTTDDQASDSSFKCEVFRAEKSATIPFFSATVVPIKYLPSFPISSSWLDRIGIATHLLQPPVPVGEPAEVEVGTSDWKRSSPVLTTKNAKLIWMDMKQPIKRASAVDREAAEGEALLTKHSSHNWWPGMSRWKIGLWWQDATMELGEPQIMNIKVPQV